MFLRERGTVYTNHTYNYGRNLNLVSIKRKTILEIMSAEESMFNIKLEKKMKFYSTSSQ